MNITISLPITFLVALLSTPALADRESDMWQQFKAQKGISELDAEFAEPAPAPAPKPEVKIVERIVEVEKIFEVEVPVPATPVAQPLADVVPTPAPVSDSSMVTAESDGYVVKFGDCKLAYRNIKCKLNIVNMQTDGSLSIYGHYNKPRSSKLYDRNGNEYWPTSVSMGNKNNKGYITNKYIQGVTAKGAVDFSNVHADTKSIALFELSIHNSETRKYNRLQFRNVNLNIQ